MRHERTDHRSILAARQARRSEVDRFVESECAAVTCGGHALQVRAGLFRGDHQGQRGCIRRDHQILGKAAFEAETRHAECAVLVVELGVEHVVARFRHAPRHVALAAVVDLPRDRRSHRGIEQGVVEARHHQLRHQVFEHRAAPRQQHRLSISASQLAAEREPAFLRQLALCDGDETAQPRFGCEQIVIAFVEPALIDVVANRQQVPRAVVQEIVFHLGQFAGQSRESIELRNARGCTGCGALQRRRFVRFARIIRRNRSGRMRMAREFAQVRHYGKANRYACARFEPRRAPTQVGHGIAALGVQSLRPAGCLDRVLWNSIFQRFGCDSQPLQGRMCVGQRSRRLLAQCVERSAERAE